MIQDISQLGAHISSIASSSLADHGYFSLAISGGSMPKLLSTALSGSPSFASWHIWYVDERHVPLHDDDSNHHSAEVNLYSTFTLFLAKVNTVKTDLSVHEAAKDYEKQLIDAYGATPRIDLVLLGLGPDGHTASLFPGHELLNNTADLIAPITDSPKPPSQRVTFTFPMINNAMVWVIDIFMLECCVYSDGRGQSGCTRRDIGGER
jgi:6-phosphogluconolactonase